MHTADVERAHQAYLTAFLKTGDGLTTAKVLELLGSGSSTTANAYRQEWERECAGLVDLEQKLPVEVRDGLMAYLGGVYRKMLDAASEGFAKREGEYQKRLEQYEARCREMAAAYDAKCEALARLALERDGLAGELKTVREAEREQHALVARLEGENRALRQTRPTAKGELVEAVKSFLTTNGFTPPPAAPRPAAKGRRKSAA